MGQGQTIKERMGIEEKVVERLRQRKVKRDKLRKR